MSIITQGYGGGSVVLQGYGPSGETLEGTHVVAVRRLPARPYVFALEKHAMDYDGVTAREPIIKHPEDAATYVLGFDDVLPEGETIAEVEVRAIERVAGDGANNLSIESEAATTTDYETAWGHIVPAGRGITFNADGGISGNAYKVTFVVTTEEGSAKGGAVIFELQS